MAPATPPRASKRSAPASPSPLSPPRPRMLKDEPFRFVRGSYRRPRDRGLVLILNVFIVFAMLLFVVVQRTRTDLPDFHPAGGTIQEKPEDDEQPVQEEVEQGYDYPPGVHEQMDEGPGGTYEGEWSPDDGVVYEDQMEGQ